ncbi:MAG: sensor domain-containing diguanylate cyclase [Candidatus Omnitrophica bacterium]|nr:sensor domain-containing diguanylate cyclase [Candidatus Omnitrophota bacterium]
MKSNIKSANRVQVLGEHQDACTRIVDSMRSGVYATDTEGNILFANQALAEMFRYQDSDELVGRNLAKELYENPGDRTVFLKALNEKGAVCDYEVRMQRKDGTRVVVSARSNLLLDKNGEVMGVEGVLNDISEQIRQSRLGTSAGETPKASQDKFETLMKDSLTQVYSYEFFRKQLGIEINRINDVFSSMCLMMIDIDSFHRYNNEFGRDGGDKLLGSIGQLLNQKSRPRDLVGRIARDQFLVMLPATKRDDAFDLAQQLKAEISGMEAKESVTCSIGVSQYAMGMTQEELFLQANMALCMAKETGKNDVCFYG